MARKFIVVDCAEQGQDSPWTIAYSGGDLDEARKACQSVKGVRFELSQLSIMKRGEPDKAPKKAPAKKEVN